MRRDILFIVKLCTLGALLVSPAMAQERTIEEYLSRSQSLYCAGFYHQAQTELQKAGAKATNLRNVSPAITTQVEWLSAMCEAQLGDGAKALERFVGSHPTSPYTNEALFALGEEHYEWGRFLESSEAFERVAIEALTDEELDRLCFKSGHSWYLLGDSATALLWLSKVEGGGKNYPHAQYFLGVINYADGNYKGAKSHFENLADDSDYAAIVPYYLLNVEYRMGNSLYVARNADNVLDGVEGARRAEIRRMAAQSTFRMEEWSEAERHIASLRDEEGATLSREENYIAGYALYRLGEWEKAADYLRGACGTEDSLTRNAAYHLADCLLRWGDKRGAMQCFSMAYGGADNDPMCEDAHYNYCKLQVELGGSNFNEEIRSLRSYLGRYPRSAHRTEIEGYLISACYAANDLRGAYDILKEFATSGGKVNEAMQKISYYYAAECYSRGEWSEAEEFLGYALDYKEYDQDIAALTLYLLGEIDYQRGEYEKAASMYDQYLAMEMTHQREYALALYNMGYANFNSSRFVAAYEDFADFADIYTTKDSLYADAYNRMGDSKAAQKEYSKAANLYRKSAATRTTEAYYGAYRVALMEGMAGNTAARIEALENILSLGKGNYVVRAHYELGNTLLVAGKYDRATKVLSDFTDRYPSSHDFVAALSDLGLAYRNTGHNDEALNTYKRIVATSRGSMAARNALGEIRNIYIERNDVDGFFAYAEAAGMSGDLGGAQRDSLSFVAAQRLYIAGDKRGASEAFDKYIGENPEGIYSPAALFYSAECYTSLGDTLGARERLTSLTSLYYNSYTQRGYERLAALSAAGADWKAAATAYKALAEMATTPTARREALDKYLSTTIASGEHKDIIAVADQIISHSEASPEMVRKARFEKAKALEASGKRNPAVAIYNSLSEDVTTPEGAESAYRIIDTAFKYGSFETAESLVYDFADKSTPHAYWLAKAFLLLGDVYTSRGDLFQARATYQSVVDGYSNKEDGIVDTALQRIESLGESNNENQ